MAKTIFEGAHAELVAVLVAARRRAGLRQVEVAARIGRNQSHISLIEMGQRRVDVVEFSELARALNADPQQLFGEFLKRVKTLGGST